MVMVNFQRSAAFLRSKKETITPFAFKAGLNLKLKSSLCTNPPTNLFLANLPLLVAA